MATAFNVALRPIPDTRALRYSGDVRFRAFAKHAEEAANGHGGHVNVGIHPGSLRITAYLFVPGKQPVAHRRNYIPRGNFTKTASTKLRWYIAPSFEYSGN